VGSPEQVARAAREVERTAREYTSAKEESDRLEAAIPLPTWPETLPALMPELPPAPAPIQVAMDDTAEDTARAPAPESPAEPRSPDHLFDLTAPAPAQPEEPAAKSPAAHVPRTTRQATAFPVASDLLITSDEAVRGARSIVVEVPNGSSLSAEVVREDAQLGLALLRVKQGHLAYFVLADQFAGGEVSCASFPKRNVFSPEPAVIQGKAPAPAERWWVALQRHPRLAGGPMLDAKGHVVGVVLASPEDPSDKLPAVALEQLKAFLGNDAPARQGNAQPGGIVQLTASR
jgi:hypothetical protein